MPGKLPHARPDDPRLDPAIRAALRRCRLDGDWHDTVRSLATGAMSPATMRCCNSGCRPCVQDVLRCTVLTLRSVHGPPPPPTRTGFALRARGRKVAGRILGKVRGDRDS